MYINISVSDIQFVLPSYQTIYIVESYRGVEQLIVIGDDFVRTSGRRLVRSTEMYSNTKFEVGVAAGDSHNTNIRMITARIHNALVERLNACLNTPKMIFIIFENDVINYVKGIKHAKVSDWPIYYTEFLTEILEDTTIVVESFKKNLPNYANREGWPKIIALAPTLHRGYADYHDRKEFIDILDEVSKRYKEVWPLRLKQIWDENNHNLFRSMEQRLTDEGLSAFWRSFDRTVLFCDKKITRYDLAVADPDSNRGEQNQYKEKKTTGYYNRYYWQRH